MFGELKDRYIFTGNIRTCAALHIGGVSDVFEPHGVDNGVLKDKNDLPYIPGSSIKGVLRSYLEKILKGRGEKVCMIPDLCSDKFNNKGLRDDKWESIKKQYGYKDEDKQKRLSEALYEEVCCICHLFGSGINAAKLKIRDAKVVEDTFLGFEYRTGVSIDRDKNKARNGALYDIEAVPADTFFEFKAVLENPDAEDLKNTIFLLNSLQSGMLQLGGMTSRGLGDIILEDLKIQHIDKDNVFDTFLKGNNKYLSLEELVNSVAEKGEV